MKTIAIVILTAAVAACAATPPPKPQFRSVALPSGSQGFEVACSGPHKSFGDCMNLAHNLCGGGYQILTQDSETRASAAVPVGRSVIVAHIVRRSMMVSCGRT